MKSSKRLTNLAITTKIALLVALMGVAALAITAYAVTRMSSINDQYRALILHEGTGALRIGDTAQHLSDASRLAYSVLTEQDETTMRAALVQLSDLKSHYDNGLLSIAKLLPDKRADLSEISSQSNQVFEHASTIIDAAARWRGDKALQIINQQFEPALKVLRSRLDSLQSESVGQFDSSSMRLNRATSQTIFNTAIASVLTLTLMIALALSVAVTHISKPIVQLTRAMERLTDRHYDDPIAFAGRRDEVGTMAMALQVFKDSMQQADRLAVQIASSEEARRLSEQLVGLIGAIPGAVFQLHVRADGWRKVLYVSERAAELHERPIDELMKLQGPIGQDLLRVSAEEAQNIHAAYIRSVRTLEPLAFDSPSNDVAGRLRWIRTMATARRAPDGGATFNGVWLDVTEQRLQARNLEVARDAAEHAALAKASFLATMSHEIRTPLNAILGMTQLVLKEPLQNSIRERVEKTMRAGRHLLGIVNDVLDFSKIEAGQMALESTPFSMTQVLDDVQELYCDSASAKGLQLVVHVSTHIPTRLLGDPHRITQIFINYLNNAIKFTETGSIRIEVSAVEEGDESLLLHCSVEDTGLGITLDQQHALFEAFQQADNSITRRYGGTGLGLAICRQLAELMGGTVGARPASDSGSIFWFTARVNRCSAAPPPVKRDVLSPQLDVAPMESLRGMRVFLVDDNELNLAVARGLLEANGLLVDTACNGASAVEMLELAERDRYTAVFMDLQMPEMDGIEATRILRKQTRFRNLPIIAMTANATLQDIERTLAAGMNGHVSKPILEGTLLSVLRQCLPFESPLRGALEFRGGLNQTALEELRKSMDAERMQMLLMAFTQDCSERVRRICAATDGDPLDWASVARDAHNLGGTAGSFGLDQLGDLAEQLSLTAASRDTRRARVLVQCLADRVHGDLEDLRASIPNFPTADISSAQAV